jgi:N-methylhydantoinase A
LGMRRIFVPPHAGVLSALGLAITSERRERMISLLARTDALDAPTLAQALERAAYGVAEGEHWDRWWVARMRYVGQGHELDVPTQVGDDGASVARRFAALHASRNGFTLDAPAEMIGLRHVASGPSHPVQFARGGASQWNATHMVDDGGTFDVQLRGPAVVALAGATLRIAPGWVGVPHGTGGWMLEREAADG